MNRKIIYWAPVVLSCIYLLTLPAIHSEGEDTLSYIMTVSREKPSGDLFHSHHLLYNVFNYVIYQLWKMMGYKADAMMPMQINNVLAAFGCFLVLIRIGKKLDFTPVLILTCILITSGTYGFWYYSVEAETYIIPAFFVLLTVHQVIKISIKDAKLSDFIIAGTYTSLAILFHQMHVLLAPAFVLYYLLLTYGRAKSFGKTFFINVAAYCLAVISLVTISYLYVGFVFYQFNFPEFIGWIRGYTKEGLWTPWSFTNFIKAAIGFAKAVFGFLYLFGFSWFVKLIGVLLPNQLFAEEKFLGLQMEPHVKWVSLIMLLLTVISFIAIIYYFIIYFRKQNFSGKRNNYGKIILFLTISFFIYATAIIVWEPMNVEFWIVTIPILALVLTFYLNKLNSHRQVVITGFVFALSLFISNFLGNILPQTNSKNDYVIFDNKYLLQHAKSTDLIITTEYINHLYLNYYTPATTLTPIFYTYEDILKHIEKEESKRILISSYFLESLTANTNLISQVSQLGNLYKLHDNGRQIIWELKKY